MTRLGKPAHILFTAALLLMTGCDQRVDVLQPSESQQYSLYGWLDVAADTQAVRVESLTDSARLGSPGKLNATVLLKDLGTDTTITLRDSFATVMPDAYRDPTQVHTFWTTYPLRRATSYRVLVQENGQTATTATTTTPDTTPDLKHNSEFFLPCSPNEWANEFDVLAPNVDEVAAAKVIYPVDDIPSGYDGLVKGYPSFDLYDTISESNRLDGYTIDVNYDSHGMCDRSAFEKPYAIVVVTIGGPGWPAWREASIDELAQPDTFSNIREGVGFVGAALSDTIRVPIRRRTPGP